jgi:hypothetical protein
MRGHPVGDPADLLDGWVSGRTTLLVVAAPSAEATGGAPESDSALQINFDLCIPRKGNCAASVPMSTFMCVCLRFICIIPGSVHLFSCSRIGRPTVRIYISTQKHECRNWDCGRANPFLGIFVSNFRYSIFAVSYGHVQMKVYN